MKSSVGREKNSNLLIYLRYYNELDETTVYNLIGTHQTIKINVLIS